MEIKFYENIVSRKMECEGDIVFYPISTGNRSLDPYEKLSMGQAKVFGTVAYSHRVMDIIAPLLAQKEEEIQNLSLSRSLFKAEAKREREEKKCDFYRYHAFRTKIYSMTFWQRLKFLFTGEL